MKKPISVLLILSLLVFFSACKADVSKQQDTSSDSEITASPVSENFLKTDDEMFTGKDNEASYSGGVTITLNSGKSSASSNSVKISDSAVTITQDGTYIISGSLENASIIVDAPDTAKPHLILNGVSVTSKTSAALLILSADKVFVTLADGTKNTLTNGGSFEAGEYNIDGAVFSKQDLTFNGTGSLSISSPAGHGIVCKDDLVLTGGTYLIVCSSHGLDANDSVRIENSDISVTSGKDGIHCENSDDTSLGFVYISSGKINIISEGDGISSGSYMQIENGSITVTAGGGSKNGSKASSDSWGGFMGRRPTMQEFSDNEDSTSMKGLKAAGGLIISNGSFTLDCADDAVHSNTTATINGGTFKIKSGDDAFHADSALTFTAGTAEIAECYEGLEAFSVVVKGGDISLTATDDGINASGGNDSSGSNGGRDGAFGAYKNGGGGMSSGGGSITISGGDLDITASGDGIDANGTLEISGGHITVTGPTQGDTAVLDYDVSGIITGGTFIGTGADKMAQSLTGKNQGVIAVKSGNISANTEILIKDKDGKTVLSCTPSLPYQMIVFSSPEISSGSNYTITAGSYSESVTAA